MHYLKRKGRAVALAVAAVVAVLTPISVFAESAIAPPTPVAPAAGATAAYGQVTFNWSAVEGATSYGFEITRAADPDFSAPISSIDVTDTTTVVDLKAGSYVWHVQSRDADGGGAWSASTAVNVDWWKPTADKPLGLHWVLDTPEDRPIDLNNPVEMGLRDFNGNVLPAPDVYDIDGEYTSAAVVSALQAQGKKVICYIDAGVYETYRGDAWKFQAISPKIWGSKDGSWEGSYWLDVRRIDELKPIMQARMQMCKDKGFDAIEPDEIDGWENRTGFKITYQDQLNYNRALAQWAHDIGMSIGQKGDIIQTRDLVDHFDWTLNEECFQYTECANPWNPDTRQEQIGLQAYVQQNKAVWVAEYKVSPSGWTAMCNTSKQQRWNSSQFKLGLPSDGGRKVCTTATSWQ